MKYMTIAAREKIYREVGDVISQSEQKLHNGGHSIHMKVIVDITLSLC